MKVVYDPSFTQAYTHDPAAEAGRMEAIVEAIQGRVTFIDALPATRDQIGLAHTRSHMDHVAAQGLYDISALAAGGAIQAARIGIEEPTFGLIRPPGHHASAGSSWGFCYFNNMAVALLTLKQEGLIRRALVLDIDLHFGDGTVNILGDREWVRIHNFSAPNREEYLHDVGEALAGDEADLIGISAGFDYHRDDWGGLLATEDYRAIGRQVREASRARGGGCFAILEGGYNHSVLGINAASLLEGLSS
jgi:acetoin utilization deacetylase AcuC-like enzyme